MGSSILKWLKAATDDSFDHQVAADEASEMDMRECGEAPISLICYSLLASTAEILEHYGISRSVLALHPRANISPGDVVATVVARGGEPAEFATARWGIPEDKGTGLTGESAVADIESMSHSVALAGTGEICRRCLVPADVFVVSCEPGREDKRYRIRLASGGLFSLAGVWRQLHDRTGRQFHACTVLTARARGSLARVAGFMPAIVPRRHYADWLHGGGELGAAASLLDAADELPLHFFPRPAQ